MPKIGTLGYVEHSVKQNHFQIKKRFGQNFLTDSHILEKIVEASEVTKKDAVIEIGPGLGALTEVLCEQAGFVLAYEIDKDLLPILEQNLKAFSNYKILNQDILKANILSDISLYLEKYNTIYLVANLPYYITTPILTGLLSQKLPISRYVMMMQLEVADRICGKPSTKDYNALSLWIEYRALAKKIMKVPRTVFIPSPNVDSAVVRLDVYKDPPMYCENERALFFVIQGAFAQRRKTLENNLSLKYDKKFVQNMLLSLGLSLKCRAEELTLSDFIKITDYITHNMDK